MWASLALALLIVESSAALETQDRIFLSNHVDNLVMEESTERALKTWAKAYNEAVLQDRSFWSTTWHQVETSLLQLQQGFERKIGLIQLSSDDDPSFGLRAQDVKGLTQDPDVAAALTKLEADYGKNTELVDVVNARQKSAAEQQKDYQAKFHALWNNYASQMRKNDDVSAAEMKKYQDIEFELRSQQIHDSKQFHSFIQVTSSIMHKESRLMESLRTVASNQKRKLSENIYRSKKELYRSRLAFVNFCGESLKQVRNIIKGEEQASFAQITW